MGPEVWQGLPLAFCCQAGLVEWGLDETCVAVELHQVKDLKGGKGVRSASQPTTPGGLAPAPLLEWDWGILSHLELLDAEHIRGGSCQHVLPDPGLPVDVDGAHRVAGEELIVDPPRLLRQLGTRTGLRMGP